MGRFLSVLSLFSTVGCEPAPARSAPGSDPDECFGALATFRHAYGGDVHANQMVVRDIARQPECFENERVPVARLRLVVASSARQTIRDLIAERDGTSAGTTDGQAACERHTALASNPRIGIGSADLTDLMNVLCAYADAASGSADGYLSALTQIESVRAEDLARETRMDLIQHAYLRQYVGGDTGRAWPSFREAYPLSEVADPSGFAVDVLLPRSYLSPIPKLFFEEQNLGQDALHDILYAHFVRAAHASGSWPVTVSLADAYVARAGYDEAFVYRVAYDCVMDGEDDYPTALRLATHLGPAEVRAAEDGRMRQLDIEGRYTVAVGPDGRRSRHYPMWDE